jgi:hypothetical protein
MSRRLPPSDPVIKVTVFMPASVHLRLREHADRTGSNVSKLCREGVLHALTAVVPETP